MKLVQGQFPVAEKGLKRLKVFLEYGVALEEVKHELEDIKHFIFHLVKHPLVQFTRRKYSRVLKINKVSGCFGLCELQNALEVADAHLAVGHDQVKNPETGSV